MGRNNDAPAATVVERIAVRGASRITSLALLGTLVGLVLLEGTAGLVLLAKRLAVNRQPTSAVGPVSEPDRELGWRPIAHNNDEARGIHTDALGVRRTGTGRPRRLFCSGDSFTWGLNVGDAQTWCAQLGDRLGVEAANFGVPAYGIDQAFLRYRIFAGRLPHAVHVFAFIDVDLGRVLRARAGGTTLKPLFAEREGRLVAVNTPLSHAWWRPGNMLASIRYVLAETDVYRLVDGATRRFRATPLDEAAAAAPLFGAILRELHALAGAAGARLLVVRLPSLPSIVGLAYPTYHRSDLGPLLASTCASLHLDCLDLHPLFLALPFGDRDRLFFDHGNDGHYTPEAHRLVAEAIADRLR